MNTTKWLDWTALIAYCGLIFWLSSQSMLPVPSVFNAQDKVMHAGAYFVMALLAWRALRHAGLSGKLTLILAALFCSLYGISDEWHQSFVPGRNPDVTDWLADTVGAVGGVVLLHHIRKRFF
ncbi:MAG: VanZ family protein [Methylomonas sp.]|nr:VanZ family protein [Methylomonas sp.]PPD20893.1 MAG: teicoplanin resistance protein VanZ [Methylomonas sp.]PPD25606.1 MAG: teicoplanin resistance protein VanZ [Methylomonas sp.]PPD36607.1 MAG: teicoplanin resistance protein VanZ [Methylomonas sp.]PPD39924.1 MAG: teicoplanin resistance protein VanZ [Methylomonas sp.]